MEQASAFISFEDNRYLAALYGDRDEHLIALEKMLGVKASSRGNTVSITGGPREVAIAKKILRQLYHEVMEGHHIERVELDARVRMLMNKGRDADEPGITPTKKAEKHAKKPADTVGIRTEKKYIKPYSAAQARYIELLQRKTLTFASGPAGTGKTYLAVAQAVHQFMEGHVDRLILSRPAVEAGENLGFLPGDMREKVDPYLRPLYDALYDMLPGEKVAKYLETGQFEIAPLAFMRGRTLRHAFVILDEAQNTTTAQMKMFLTRLGEGTNMAITGDLTQVDLPRTMESGFRDAITKLEGVDDIGVAHFRGEDCVRHPLTARIIKAYSAQDPESDQKDGI